MRNHVRSFFPLAFVLATTSIDVHAAKTAPLEQCGRVASQCREQGKSALDCQRQVDECMSDNACEEVYLSCLELMELEENLTEAACARKRDECRKGRGG